MSVFTNPVSTAGRNSEAYINAILELLSKRDPMRILETTPDGLRVCLADLTPEERRRPEQAGKWSALNVVQHLAHSEIVWAYRIRLVVAEDRPTLTGYDQDRWVSELGAQNDDVDEVLDQFVAERRFNLRFLTRLPTDAFERVGIHSERGEERLDHMVRLYAGHDLVHLRQLERIADAVRA